MFLFNLYHTYTNSTFLDAETYDFGADGTVDQIISYEYDLITGILESEIIDSD